MCMDTWKVEPQFVSQHLLYPYTAPTILPLALLPVPVSHHPVYSACAIWSTGVNGWDCSWLEMTTPKGQPGTSGLHPTPRTGVPVPLHPCTPFVVTHLADSAIELWDAMPGRPYVAFLLGFLLGPAQPRSPGATCTQRSCTFWHPKTSQGRNSLWLFSWSPS